MKLTNTTCKNSKPLNTGSNSPRKLADGYGLYLFVMPNGSKYWRFVYRYREKQKTYALGVYPEISLKEARDKTVELRKILHAGKDPAIEKKKLKCMHRQNAENTFETIAREWYDNKKESWTPKYAKEILKRLEDDIFPEIGVYPIKEIEPPFLLQVIRKIESRGAVDLAKRQLQKCGEVFRYAIATGRGVRDPSADIGDALKVVKSDHFASIDINEIPDFLSVLRSNKARLYPTTLNALKLMMLTFVRTNELINARWEEIDFARKLWTIPAERMKMKKVHLVPLSEQAIEILKEQRNKAGKWEHVFPSLYKPRQPISNNTILGALRRMGYQGRMTGHGFRSLAMSTIKQELGYRHEVIDRQLAHMPKSKITRAYDRADFLDERKVMMQDWANYLDSM